MKAEQIRVLEAVISAMKISNSDLEDWFKTRKRGNFIPTDLPLVYCKGNEFFVENGLDLKRKKELWGIQLLSGVMVALTCGSGNNVSETTWGKVKKFAEKMSLNGKAGFLPSKGVLKKHWGTEEQTRFTATVKVLKENEIEADGYLGCIWCSEEYGLGYPYFFGLNSGSSVWTNKLTTGKNGRVAVAF